MKILIAVANYGTQNDRYLNQLLTDYRSLPHEVDVVVLTNVPKNLGPDVEVKVGLPSRNPKSLPFAHKQVFADRRNDYDLFIYSEDDTPVSNRNIRAFLASTEVLNEREIAGFLRTEVGHNGKEYFPDAFDSWHWEPTSVQQRGEYTFAFFNNEHAACYILTRAQLASVIQSGGFLEGPHQGKHQLLESAATDVYTQCGFTKLICISHIDDFLVPHLANKYLSLEGCEVRRQISALMAIGRDERPSDRLLETAAELPSLPWSKSYYEPAQRELLSLVPENTRSLLSVGCGWGAVEGQLVQNGVEVVAVPLDSVISTCAEARGVRTVSCDFKAAREELSNKRFDCILVLHVLHFLRDPLPILASYTELLSPGGSMIVGVPNFKYLKILWRSIQGWPGYRNLGSYDKTGVNVTTHRVVQGWLKSCGLTVDSTVNALPERLRFFQRMPDFAAPALAPKFIMRGRKHSSTTEHHLSDAFRRNRDSLTDMERREVFQ